MFIKVYAPADLPTCLPAYLPVCLPTCLPTYLHAYLSAYTAAYATLRYATYRPSPIFRIFLGLLKYVLAFPNCIHLTSAVLDS